MKKLLALVFLLFASPALAQNPQCPTRPAGDSTNACASTAFVQSAVTVALAPPITLNGTSATLPVLTINPLANSFGQGLSIAQSPAGSSATAKIYNLFNCNPDQAVITGANFGVCFNVAHTINGSLVQGGRISINAYLELAAPTNASNLNRNYSALLGTGTATSSDGGTNTGVGAKGAIFGASAWGDLQSGATNIFNVTGGEYNCSIRTGASSRYKSCMQLIEHALDAVSGAELDTLLAISGQAGAIGTNNGILFSDFAGQHAVKSTGTLIATTGGTFATAMDFSLSTLTNLLKGPNSFAISAIGNITAPSATEWLFGTSTSASSSNVAVIRLNASTGSIIDLLGSGNIYGRIQSDNVNGLSFNASAGPATILLQSAGVTVATVSSTAFTAAQNVASPLFKTNTALITATNGGSTAAFTANMIGSTGGPTTAAQNGWVKQLDSSGATIWVPVWK